MQERFFDLGARPTVAEQALRDLAKIDDADVGLFHDRFDDVATRFLAQQRDQSRRIEDDVAQSRSAATSARLSAMNSSTVVDDRPKEYRR